MMTQAGPISSQGGIPNLDNVLFIFTDYSTTANDSRLIAYTVPNTVELYNVSLGTPDITMGNSTRMTIDINGDCYLARSNSSYITKHHPLTTNYTFGEIC